MLESSDTTSQSPVLACLSSQASAASWASTSQSMHRVRQALITNAWATTT